MLSDFFELVHDQVNCGSDKYTCKEHSSFGQGVADSFPVNACNKQSISKQPQSTHHNNGFGLSSKLRTVEPPLDKQKDHEVNEKRIHHTHPEDDSIRVFEGSLDDSGIFFINAVPLNKI